MSCDSAEELQAAFFDHCETEIEEEEKKRKRTTFFYFVFSSAVAFVVVVLLHKNFLLR